VLFLKVPKIQALRQQRGGWGQKIANLDDLQYYLC
jgi:hypothetical protein